MINYFLLLSWYHNSYLLIPVVISANIIEIGDFCHERSSDPAAEAKEGYNDTKKSREILHFGLDSFIGPICLSTEKISSE